MRLSSWLISRSIWRNGSSGVVLLIRFAPCRGREGLVPARRLRLGRGDIPRLEEGRKGALGLSCLWIVRVYDLFGLFDDEERVV